MGESSENLRSENSLPSPPSSARHDLNQDVSSANRHGTANVKHGPLYNASSGAQRKVADLQRQFAKANTDLAAILEEMDNVSRRRIDIIMDLRGMGFTNTEMAGLLDLSPQRVSALVQKRRRYLDL